jgi:2-dehydropantoate 2-reductase
MRVVVVGAGAIGGLVGARLHQQGLDVTLVARGAHAEALSAGLVLETPDESVRLSVPVVTEPAAVDWTGDTIVLLGVKGQQTEHALAQLVPVAPVDTPVVCMQNGVENERRVLRRFPNTYAMCVVCPATHLRPGVIQAHSAPISGLLDLGRFPQGVDDTARAITAALGASTFLSVAQPDIMRWKYRKLLQNLSNAADALCGREGRDSPLVKEAQREGEAVLLAAGITVATAEEDRAHRGDHLRLRNTTSGEWSGGSSWQSLARGTGSIEVEFLNGEIVLLGALHGVPTPVNSVLLRLALDAAREGRPPGSWRIRELSEAAGVSAP